MVQHFKRCFDYEFLRKVDGKGRILFEVEYECSFLKINVRDIFQQHMDSQILITDIINLIIEYVKYNKHQQLKQFIFDYYNQSLSGLYYSKWHRTTNVAILCGDIENLELFWGLVYYYGGNPWFSDHLYYAAEFGNLKMFQHVLYAYNNYVEHEHEEISIKKLKDLALKNIDQTVNNFIDKLFDGIPKLLKDGDTFSGCPEGEIEDCQHELKLWDPNEDCEYQKNQLKIALLYFTNLNKLINQ